MPGLVIGGGGHYVGEGWVGSGDAAGGATEHFGSATVDLTFTVDTVGRKNAKGALAVPLTFDAVTAGKKNAKGALALPIVFDIATAGAIDTGEKFGAVDLPLTFGASVTGHRTAKGAADLALAVSIDTLGRKNAKGAAAVPLTFTITTTGSVPGQVVFVTGFFDEPTLSDVSLDDSSPEADMFDEPTPTYG
jgi:hypothetical protein